MSNELTLRNGDMIRNVPDLLMIAELLVKSQMLPTSIKTKEAAAAIILKGREIGMPVMESFALINVIQGKPTIAPQGMIALARRTRELEDLKIEDDGNTCTVTVKRKGQSPFVSTFSVQDAAAMGLSNKDNWTKQPKVMRQWRAISANFRITFPDVIGGMYTPEELGATVDAEGEVIEGTVVVDQTAEQRAELEHHAEAVGKQMAEERTAARAPRPGAYSRTHPPLSPVQRNKLLELTRLVHGEINTEMKLEALFMEQFQHGSDTATYEDGARLTGFLLAEIRKGKNAQPQEPTIPDLPEKVHVPSHENGNGKNGVSVPAELKTMLASYANRTYATPEKAKGARGLAAGILDEYAGDTERRRSFLMAVFGKDSSSALTDGQVYAILAWKDHPRAKDEVNRVIAEWLKIQGQQELFPETQPALT